MNVRTTQVPGEPAQYNGWTGPELLELVGRLETENKRLKDALESLEKAFQEIERLKGRLANEQETNRKFRLLLRRAADALALELVSRHSQVEIQDYSYLIAELRKAAE